MLSFRYLPFPYVFNVSCLIVYCEATEKVDSFAQTIHRNAPKIQRANHRCGQFVTTFTSLLIKSAREKKMLKLAYATLFHTYSIHIPPSVNLGLSSKLHLYF